MSARRTVMHVTVSVRDSAVNEPTEGTVRLPRQTHRPFTHDRLPGGRLVRSWVSGVVLSHPSMRVSVTE